VTQILLGHKKGLKWQQPHPQWSILQPGDEVPKDYSSHGTEIK
jgi:hypothetical protein